MIGISLCQYISSLNGYFVYAVCRKESSGLNKLPINNQLKVIFFEIENICNIANKIDHADVFINLAWTNTDHEGRNNAELQSINVNYAKDAMRLAALIGCRLFVEAGSQAEYGNLQEFITEETPCNPEGEYGKAKLRVQQEGSILCNSLGIKYLHLRIFSTFGENDRPWTLIMSAIDKMLKNEDLSLTSCTQKWNFLYVNDCAKQVFLLCEYLINKNTFNSGIYHIASKDTRPLKNFIEEMRFVLKSSSMLQYGSVVQTKQVSLDPSTSKTEKTIGFVNEFSFEEAVKIIANKNYNIQL